MRQPCEQHGQSHSASAWKKLRTRLSDHLVRRWPVNAGKSHAIAPIVSFCFDDFYHSAAQAGAEVLERYGMKATYYVAGGLMGSKSEGLDLFTQADLIALSNAGHEIGCHTYHHVRLPDCSAQETQEELVRNRSFILENSSAGAPISFAYPFGAVSLRAKKLIGRQFGVCRGIDKGINRGRVDFGQLKAVEIHGGLPLARVRALLDTATCANGWLIFFTHDVSRNPSPHGCAPSQLAVIAQEISRRGIAVMTVRRAAMHVNRGSALAAISPEPASWRPRGDSNLRPTV